MNESQARIHALPCWTGPIAVKPLKGGLSNESWLVSDALGSHVVRFGRDFPFHHVFRDRELMVAEAANAAGFAPKIEYSQTGVMVSQFLGAKTYGAEDVRGNLAGIAEMVRDFHTTMPRHVSGPGFLFWVFHVISDYARTLNTGGSRMVSSLPRWLELSRALEEVQVPLPVVFGHNDLLPANLLDDGERLWLIDFEYAGFSTAMFDLAGLASNAEMDESQSHALLAAYFTREPEPEMIRSHLAMQCASMLRETMWSLVSELYLDAPGADYAAYTAENLQRFEALLDNYQSRYGKILS